MKKKCPLVFNSGRVYVVRHSETQKEFPGAYLHTRK